MADNRVHVTFRISAKGRDWADEQAAEYGLGRSDVIRACVAAASTGEAKAAVTKILKQMKDRP